MTHALGTVERQQRDQAKTREARARAREVIRRAIQTLRHRYPQVTQQSVAARCGVDRSMVAKVWTGEATSAKVLAASVDAFRAAGWNPRVVPGWAREVREREAAADKD